MRFEHPGGCGEAILKSKGRRAVPTYRDGAEAAAIVRRPGLAALDNITSSGTGDVKASAGGGSIFNERLRRQLVAGGRA